MVVDTKKVDGRRMLRFESLYDVLADAEQLAAGDVRMLGNWSLAQAFSHVAAGFNSSLDGSSFKPPFFVRMLAPLMRNKFINKELPCGFPTPQEAEGQFLPQDSAETQTALDELCRAVKRLQQTEERAKHPLFGDLSRQDSDNFQMRHAEMHMSFAVPKS